MNRGRSNRKRNQDLELRLGHSNSDKGRALTTMQNIALSNVIVVEDDDDVIHMSSSMVSIHHEVQASSMVLQVRNSAPRRSLRVQPALSDEDLELRLAVGGTSSQVDVTRISSDRNVCRERNPAPSCTINIVDDGDDDLTPYKRRRQGLASSSNNPPVQVNELNLNCPICMDSMKEETSTVCGHIFCNSCILSAIQFQKKCPTCRRKLTDKNIHRIYLDSHTT
ncbi:E3 ubiquitin-protein ligase BRE1 isoform X2 [Cryptomeria japonica]|uniref:E3 ubiquitin-protein ligase BRE1 isoform X2 n=1 Tax=Cryptomeria japonica TaxID=3369 RepID=UPI0025ACE6E3|nr:E3 ubiquitin-protein ligase BRE1 isoform X2 [Cryptomeria japonica]XP_059067289.1 E3 ubiquitin-protein ligase BRE1 isoform X2 [Cryptomeria japonica]